MGTFELNGERYVTDAETLDVIRRIAPAAQSSGDASAVAAMMELGLLTGRIRVA